MKWTESQRVEIAEEVERVLADSKFSTSQRCVSLLRHLVEYALNGDQDRIKERTLGIDVFGRDPDYDVNADPIVRRTAAELRKRLAQYYQDSEIAHAVRIRLSLGSYLPQFAFAGQEPAGGHEADGKELVAPLRVAESELSRPEVYRRRLVVFSGKGLLFSGVAVFVVLVAALLVARADFWRTTGYLIWKPFLGSSQGLFVCIPDDRPVQAIKAHPVMEHSDSRLHTGQDGSQGGAISNALASVLFIDANNANRINTRLSSYRTAIALRSTSMTRLHQFRRRPIVLVGGFNNPWSLSELSGLRYSLQSDEATNKKWIQDAQNPSSRSWQIMGAPEQATADYALITRFWDNNTGGWMMVLSGLGPFGTEAAVILMTDLALEGQLPVALRTAKNFQIVLKASVIDGSDGSPQILALHTW